MKTTVDDEGFIGGGRDTEVRNAVAAREGGVIGAFVLDKCRSLDGFLAALGVSGWCQRRGDGSDVGILILPESLELVETEIVVHLGDGALSLGRGVVIG